MFYIPVGPQPFPVGARVRSAARPWWGVGEVIASDSLHGWRFRVRWSDGTSSTGQVEALALVSADTPTSAAPKPSTERS